MNGPTRARENIQDSETSQSTNTALSPDALSFAKFFYGLADLARQDLRKLEPEGWAPRCLKEAILFCRIAVGLLAEDALGFEEFRACVGALRRIYWTPSCNLKTRLWAKETFDQIFRDMMPLFDWKYEGRLHASQSTDAIIERQRILQFYNFILAELREIRSATRKRPSMIQEFRKRHRLPKSFRIGTPSESARRIISAGHPSHPGREQLKHILIRARREKQSLLRISPG